MATMTELLTAEAVYEVQRERDTAYARAVGCGDLAAMTAAERTYAAERYREYDIAQAMFVAAREQIGGRVYRVPAENLDGLGKRVAKINRRAEKLGVEGVRYVVTGETWELERRGDDGRVVEVVEHEFVVVGAQVVKLAGWCFAATIEHDEEEGNIIRQVPFVEADLAAYRTAAPWCFHCETVRRRIDTFVVLHEDGRTEQVGRNCLVDFLGADAKYAAQQAEWLCDLEAAFEDAEDEGMRGGRGVEAIELEEFLTHVALSIRESRWVSRGVARDEGAYATADHALANLRDCRKAGYREPGPKEYFTLPLEEDRVAGAATVLWARETWGAVPIDERGDFEHNMAVATARDFLPVRRVGLAAYAVQARRKAIEVEVRKAAAAQSEFVGEVGKRAVFTVTIARIVELRDRYAYNDATKPLYLMLDAAGNSLKWFASGWTADVVQGGTYEVKGTVKAHDDDEKFGKATVLTRCKVMATIDEPGGADEATESACEGHPAGPDDPMGETVFCDGRCTG